MEPLQSSALVAAMGLALGKVGVGPCWLPATSVLRYSVRCQGGLTPRPWEWGDSFSDVNFVPHNKQT